VKLERANDLEVLEDIKDKFHRLPMVLVPASREEMASVTEVALELKVQACLYKPFEAAELLERLAEVRRQELREALGLWHLEGG